jgi:hypothetical protein
MKKVIIGLSAVLFLAVAVVFVVNAQDNKTNTKSKTEVVQGKGPSASCCSGMQEMKASCCSKSMTNDAKCDSAKCKKENCDKTKEMSCCKSKTGTATTQSGCSSSCKMKTGTQTK